MQLFLYFSRPLCPVLSIAKHGVINSGSPVCIGQTCPEFKPTSESCAMSQHQKQSNVSKTEHARTNIKLIYEADGSENFTFKAP